MIRILSFFTFFIILPSCISRGLPEKVKTRRFFFGSQRSVWPVRSYKVSSEFGPRGGKLHEGIDISAALGSSIFAVSKGVVVFAGSLKGYGKTVILKHQNYKSLYAHCSDIKVRKGQKVRQGQVIANVGSTGKSTGPHLHFEYISFGVKKNPRDLLGYR